jgi:hypothetical protein
MKRIPTFLEINTNDLTEYKVTYSKVIYRYHVLTRESVLKNAAGMFFLTTEAARNYAHYQRPYQVIGDSIDFSRYPIPEPPGNETPRLVFMGLGISPWFGVDKVIMMAERFPDWSFDIIGIAKNDLSGRLRGNITAHGYLNQTRYEEIISRADIGIGTLALHRIGMDESTPLKVREYLAYGLPTIIGYRDTDLPTKTPFVLSLPNSENNVQDSLKLIERFVQEWSGRRIARSEISYLGLDLKEEKRLEFIRQYSRSTLSGNNHPSSHS